MKKVCSIKNYSYFAYVWEGQAEVSDRKTASLSESTKSVLRKL